MLTRRSVLHTYTLSKLPKYINGHSINLATNYNSHMVIVWETLTHIQT